MIIPVMSTNNIQIRSKLPTSKGNNSPSVRCLVRNIRKHKYHHHAAHWVFASEAFTTSSKMLKKQNVLIKLGFEYHIPVFILVTVNAAVWAFSQLAMQGIPNDRTLFWI